MSRATYYRQKKNIQDRKIERMHHIARHFREIPALGDEKKMTFIQSVNER